MVIFFSNHAFLWALLILNFKYNQSQLEDYQLGDAARLQSNLEHLSIFISFWIIGSEVDSEVKCIWFRFQRRCKTVKAKIGPVFWTPTSMRSEMIQIQAILNLKSLTIEGPWPVTYPRTMPHALHWLQNFTFARVYFILQYVQVTKQCTSIIRDTNEFTIHGMHHCFVNP